MNIFSNLKIKRVHRRNGMILFLDEIFTLIALSLALVVFYNGKVPIEAWQSYRSVIWMLLVISIIIYHLFGFWDKEWVLATIPEYLLVMLGLAVQEVLVAVFMVGMNHFYPLAVYVISFLLKFFFISMIRLCYCFYYKYYKFNLKQELFLTTDKNVNYEASKIRVLIIGAGDCGYQLSQEFVRNKEANRVVVGFIDDYKAVQLDKKSGIYILGDRYTIPLICNSYQIQEIIFALPNTPLEEQRAIYKICVQTKCRLRTVPFFNDLVQDSLQYHEVRTLRMQDLIDRDPIDLDLASIHQFIRKKTILITGGGGSIGAELAKQAAYFEPKRIVLFDSYENDVYELQETLLQKYGHQINVSVRIGTVRDQQCLEDIIKHFKPKIIFHTALYKHVPLMEKSSEEAVKNNIFGTNHVIDLAGKLGVENVVLLSSNEAVQPINVLGGSNRICELLLQTVVKKYPKTTYSAVRVGNLLGSHGGIISLFIHQLEEKKIISVTDPNAKRFFMTIPEAARLVLEVGVNAESGDIFFLDMGKAVKIVDLARQFIQLLGYQPDIEVPIVYTGLKPGERLVEEQSFKKGMYYKTTNKKIYLLKAVADIEQLKAEMDQLRSILKVRSEKLELLIQDIIENFTVD